ncbi:hypothetical protein O6H91_08G075700 [Diphasiastrum complanatum]|uniref:Uncharacterized protein n=1 Tax=Diphasiastrum complanatum TaxID=34168 RepID=A0ACC2CZ14_DIPCM|nr:hypothetical protein O6H91_08G075700 [Diphasiastrum complanatum]
MDRLTFQNHMIQLAGSPIHLHYATRSRTRITCTWMQVVILLFLSCFTGELHAGSSSDLKSQTFVFSLISERATSSVRHRRLTAHPKHKRSGFRAELMHRDYTYSPLGVHNITRLERFRLAVGHSKDRAKYILANNVKHGASSTLKASQTDFTAPVASDNGAYIMQLKLGTPPQTLLAILDTGSDLVWVQCKPCRRCHSQQGPIFSTSSSSSYNNLSCSSPQCKRFSNRICGSNCQYLYEYGDQSGSMGDFSSETITMATTSGGQQQIPNFSFGCGHTNIGSFGLAGGIVGLGQGAVSLTTQLGGWIQKKFSYCLVSFDDALYKTSPLFFGSAANIRGSKVQSTPILKQGSTYYYVGLGGISVGGTLVNISLDGGTIIDSGTTLTLLEDSAYSLVRAAFKNAIQLPSADGTSAGFDLCFDVTGLSSYQVPNLGLHLTNTDFNPPSENYFLLIDPNTLCLAMDSSNGLGLSIIGNLMQQNYHFEYDRGRSTLFFSPATCDSL